MPEEFLALLAALMGKKGGVDLSSALNDPWLSLIAGTYQGEPQKSEGDIYAEFAPTLMSIQASEPEGSWRKVAASQIASGVPAYRVKDNILALASEDPSALGMMTSKEATAFVDELAAENQKAQNELTKQAEQQDPFQKAGLPSAKQQYTSEEIVQMYPEAFKKIAESTANPPAQIKAMLDRIAEAGKSPVMKTVTPKTPEQEKAVEAQRVERQQTRATQSDENVRLMVSNGVARRYGLTQEQVMNPDRKDPLQVRANSDYLREFGESAKLVADLKTSDSGVGGLLGGLAKAGGRLAAGPVLGSFEALKNIATYRMPTSADKYEREKEAAAAAEAMKPKTVVSKSGTAAKNKILGEAANIVANMVGGSQYNERYARALADTLAQKTAQSGRTPLTDAILRNALVARAFRK